MIRKLLTALAAVAALLAPAAALAVPPIPPPAPPTAYGLGAQRLWVNARPPTINDDTTKGYVVGATWNYGGRQWTAVSVTAGAAVWQPQSLQGGTGALCVVVSSCQGVYGAVKLNPAYSGNAFTETRSSDSTTLAIGWVSGPNGLQIADWASADAFCSGSTYCYITTLNDQSGNGYDLTQSTLASSPVNAGEKVAGLRAITFRGNGQTSYISNSSLPITTYGASSFVWIGRSGASAGQNSWKLWQVGSLCNFFGQVDATIEEGCSSNSNIFGVGNRGLLMSDSFIIESHTSTTTSLMMNNYSWSGSGLNSTVSTTAATGLTLGDAAVQGRFNLLGFAAYNFSITATQRAAIAQNIESTFGMQPQAQDAFVFTGDSITMGTETGSGVFRNEDRYFDQVISLLNRPFTYYNWGVASQTAANRASNLATDLGHGPSSGSSANNILFFFAGTNDIAQNSLSASSVYSSMQSACATAHTYKFKCVVASPTPRNSSFSGTYNTAALFEAQRQALRTLLSAGWTSFADGYVDFGADPVIGTQAAGQNTSYFGDGLHPTALASAYLAQDVVAVVNPLMK